MTNLQQETLDKYHSGRMGDAEMRAFESKVHADPSLKEEFDLQSDIMNCLKEHRKLELKARLNAIDVRTSWSGYVQKPALMKFLGVAVVASVITTGIFTYFIEDKENNDTPIIVDAPQTGSMEYGGKLGKEKSLINETKPEKPKRKQLSNEVTGENLVVQENINESSAKLNRKAKAFKPVFEAPLVESIADEEQFIGLDIDKLPENSAISVNESPIDVKVEITKNKSIKYKYYDGKLFLNGDFNKAPYQILEINRSTGRKIFIYYLGSYYKVEITDQLTELPLVEDTQVIRELQPFHENK